jgi:hypothetical protein
VLARSDAAGRLDAIQARHPDVHEHHVGPGPQHGLDRLEPIRGLSDDAQIVLGLQQPCEAGAHERLIVGDHDTDAHAPVAWIGSRARTRYRRPSRRPRPRCCRRMGRRRLAGPV